MEAPLRDPRGWPSLEPAHAQEQRPARGRERVCVCERKRESEIKRDREMGIVCVRERMALSETRMGLAQLRPLLLT